MRPAQGPTDTSWTSAGSDGARLLGLVIALALFAVIVSQVPLRETDIAVYAKAAERVFTGGEDPYPRRDGNVLPFTYPPTALPLLWPIAALSAPQLGEVMRALNLLLTLAVMVIVVGDLARDDPTRRLLFWGPLYIATFGGLYLNLQFGQINLLLLLLLWGYWRRLREDRQSPAAGALLALGCIAKPHYALLALGAGPRPGLRLIAGGLLGGGLLLALSLWVAPSGSWLSWWREIVATTSLTELPPGHSSIAAPWNRSLAGAVARFLVPNQFSRILADDPALAAHLSSLAILLVLAISAAVLWRSMRRSLRPTASQYQARGPVDRDLELSIIAITVFLIAPASWTHHLVMLLPAALVLLRERVLAFGVPLSSRLTAGLVLAVLALTLDDLIPRELRTVSLPLMTLMTVGVLALWLLLTERLWRRSTRLTPNAHHRHDRILRRLRSRRATAARHRPCRLAATDTGPATGDSGRARGTGPTRLGRDRLR
ncbi:glycosyltransferase 87 family protein [Halochromatium glycolicum]|nr:glycosyltransferase family 87 protein [Halochromatium glycolicum]